MTIGSALKAAAVPAVLSSLALALPAQAAVYNVNLSGGGASATGTITTDDTLGALTAANITGWTLDIANGSASASLTSAAGSRVRDYGTAMSATATGLFFDFSATGYVIFENWPRPAPSVANFLCFTGNVSCGGASNRVSITVDGPVGGFGQSGVQQIASAAAVPEPASWAMMIGGLGIAGAALRRRTQRLRFA